MASVNKVLLIGNLTRDPQMDYTPQQTACTKFGIAMNRKFGEGGQKEEVTYVDITVWGKQAEACNKYLSKGSQVHVEGRLKFDQWTAQDGSKRQKLYVTAEHVTFLGAPSSSSEPNTPQHQESDDVPF